MNEQREPGWTRHCARCGSALPAHSQSCTECGARWERPDLSPGEVGHTIDVLSAAREAGRIPQFPFEATRQALEKLRSAAPRPRDAGGRRPSAPQTAAPAATPSRPRPTKRPPSPSRARALASRAPDARPATPAGPPLADTLRSWAARRQADILLYLGAFLLTAAAVTFVAYQGEAVGDLWRFVIVTAYTGAFLTAGLLLPRWERIREAGPVFLALGAVLVPIDLFALRAATSGGDLPSDVAILIGSAACAALYLTLAARGYGRWYTVPAVPAAMLAWGALGSVVNVPGGWFGAWYEVPAGVAWLVSSAVDWKPIRFLRRGAVTTSFVALLYSLGALGFDEANEWVLPVTLGIITAALAGGLPLRRSILAFAVLPLAAAATTAAALQAATDLGWPWYALAFGFAGSGYLLVSEYDTARLRPFWRLAAFPVWLLGLGVAHVGFALDPVAREALPATYLLILAGAGGGVFWWRTGWREGLGALSPASAGLVASLVWAIWDIPLEWLPAFAVAGAGGYLVVADYDSAHGPRWRWAALAGGGGALLISLELAGLSTDSSSELVSWQWPVSLGISLGLAAAGVARWRLRWRPGISVVPALGAALPAALLWAGFDMVPEWTAAFIAAAAFGYLVPAETDRAQREAWRSTALAIGALAVAVAHLFALRDDPGIRAALPITYLIVLVAAVVDGARRPDATLLIPPALVAAGGMAVLWSLEVDPAWWACVPVAVGLLMALGHPLWSRHPVLGQLGWAYSLALAGGAALAFAGLQYEQNLEGLLTGLGAALTFAAAAVWARGRVVEFLTRTLDQEAAAIARSERLVVGFAGAAFLFAAAGHFNAALEIQRDDRAGVFVAIGAAAWIAVAGLGRDRAHLALFAPIASAGFAIAAATSVDWAGTLTAVLALATLMPVLAFATTRAWVLWLVSFAFAALTARAFWYWQDLDIATLPLGYAVAAGVLWAALMAVRAYGPIRNDRDAVIQALSWVPWVLSAASAVIVLDTAGDSLRSGDSLVTTREWAFAAVVLAALSAAVGGEGLRYRHRAAVTAGSAGLVLSLLMFIGITEPENVQAFTLPIGVYLVVLGLSFRRSEPLFGEHMAFHEAVIVAGVLALVLPPAEQSFEPGGGRYGFEVIGLGLAFLAVGFLVHARWLVPAGVLSLTGVAVRWVTGGYVTIPYWLVLGVLGTLLIAGGVVVLFQRDAWDATRERIINWWLGSLGHPA